MKIGVDYGSKMAGTTVIAYQKGGLINLEKSVKNQDADQMIIDFVTNYRVDVVGIDAPLSLPGVYNGLDGFTDYFYRACDKELKAMSPMFLGGLTARAMKLKKALEAQGISVFETYPVKTGKDLGLAAFGYRKKAADYDAIIKVLEAAELFLAPKTKVTTSHDLDSILALYTTIRIDQVKVKNKCGHEVEGVIHY